MSFLTLVRSKSVAGNVELAGLDTGVSFGQIEEITHQQGRKVGRVGIPE